jgi:hypothetical protein
MSISEREQQTLDSMGDGLARSAPKLASMLAMFSWLTAGEEMPVHVPFRRAARVWGTGAAGLAGRVGPGRLGRRRFGRRGAWRLLWLVVAVALLALTLTLSHGTGGSTCIASRIMACGQAPAPAHPGPRPSAGI